MSKQGKSRLEDAAQEIDLRLGDLLGQLGEALHEAAGRLGQGESGEIRRERSFDTGDGPIRASAGIRISTLGGAAAARATQTRRPENPVNRPERPVADPPDTTEPPKNAPTRVEATVLEEPDHWSLVADMPGIAEGDITLTVAGDLLRIEGQTGARQYLVETVKPPGWDGFTASLRNGILEVTARKAGGSA
jgi:HSP20 family molecular chaperone IbpA